MSVEEVECGLEHVLGEDSPRDPHPEEPVVDKDKKRRRRRILAGVFLLFLLIGIVLLIIFLLRRDDSSTVDRATDTEDFTAVPSSVPSLRPSLSPSAQPSSMPSFLPSALPTADLCPNDLWQQIGQDVAGSSPSQNLGLPVVLSRDGNVLATSQYFVGSSVLVQVRVFRLTNGQWLPLGAPIVKGSFTQRVGRTVRSVALSENGTTLAFGTVIEGGSDTVSVYTLSSSNQWLPVGAAIGPNGPGWGRFIALSGDGRTVVVSERGCGGVPGDVTQCSPTGPGYVQVYSFESGLWQIVGNNAISVEGEVTGDAFGSDVFLSRDGRVLAVSAPLANDFAGYIQVYRFDNGTWVELGGKIRGENPNDEFGASVVLSDGNGRYCVAVGASQVSSGLQGYVEVHCFENDTWTRIGNRMSGTAEDNREVFGFDTDISNDGTSVVVGVISSNFPSRAMVFQLVGDSWESCWELFGDADNDLFGRAVSISDDGTRVAVGGPSRSGNGKRGYVRVFEKQGQGLI